MDRRQFLSLAMVSMLGGCVGGDDSEGTPTATTGQKSTGTPAPTNTPTPIESPTPTSSPTPTDLSLKLGEVFGDGDLKAVVQRMRRKQKLSEYDEAEAGNDFAVVRLVVKNVGSKYDYDLDGFPPLFKSTLKDSQGYAYDTVFAFTNTPFVSGVLSPGEVMRGDKVYTVPDDSSGLKLQFNFSNERVFNLNRVAVDLSQKSNNPKDLQQNLNVDVHELGESVEMEGLEVIINSVNYIRQNNTQHARVDVTFSNNTGAEIPDSHIRDLSCKDGRGRHMSGSIAGFDPSGREYSTDTPLAPGEVRRGKVQFELEPPDPEKLYCTFEFSEYIENGTKEFWALK